jgi:hypothetical protein
LSLSGLFSSTERKVGAKTDFAPTLRLTVLLTKWDAAGPGYLTSISPKYQASRTIGKHIILRRTEGRASASNAH